MDFKEKGSKDVSFKHPKMKLLALHMDQSISIKLKSLYSSKGKRPNCQSPINVSFRKSVSPTSRKISNARVTMAEPFIHHKKSFTMINVEDSNKPTLRRNHHLNLSARSSLFDELDDINAMKTPSTVKEDPNPEHNVLDESLANYYSQDPSVVNSYSSTTPIHFLFALETPSYSSRVSPIERRNQFYSKANNVLNPKRSDTPTIPTKKDPEEKQQFLPEIKLKKQKAFNVDTKRAYNKSVSPHAMVHKIKARRNEISRKRPQAITPFPGRTFKLN
ncbi:unnamed protein product [Blepharisma stoltei]|uniref:Uncharacterized protein n=1 Tax=Blepharisma stoltei TaxID=1481888 RepID=A0AAU9JXK9_9CILI|nr:unnamed protein product [Blepharisma stoltei]